MIWKHQGLQGHELTKDGIMPRVIPVDSAEHVGPLSKLAAGPFDMGHLCAARHGGFGRGTYIMRTDIVEQSIPANISLMNSSRLCISPVLSKGMKSGTNWPMSALNASGFDLLWNFISFSCLYMSAKVSQRLIGVRHTYTPLPRHELFRRDVFPHGYFPPELLGLTLLPRKRQDRLLRGQIRHGQIWHGNFPSQLARGSI